MGFPGSSAGKESTYKKKKKKNESTYNADLIPGSGRYPGEEIGYPPQYPWVSQVVQMVENLPECRKPEFDLWDGKIPWRRVWQPPPVFLPGESPWTAVPGGLQSMGSQSQTGLSD